ncbi:hypothetical protein KP509_37G057400 [Ceratopteris richardii]|uniref:Partial AB-hydrolase lipase domain-containing protein n=1 Tax=Ceratopteris richardii TaxID=49495 RepID=A0A8T2Q9A9_CERRI|nr:hypothetical protein KP509_37G057400 [Ceratopteris richardii]KAH7280237.1 hypothetical protein KP509_37G057400 [Ceratopteris richardii]KAH7280238.1 hypothetical protein KP509_37G057400 [Ceratopteris richardii]KAH7280239.1 hypothetical protein KP509_37G057400 [Ceratopteris richardii]
MQRLVDSILGVAKESLKAFSQEAFNNSIKLINGISALILTFLPGKATILEGIQGWELRPTLRAPHLPRWMEDGVSSFNQFIHDYAASSDGDSESEYESGLEDNDSYVPASPSSQSSHISRASSFQSEKRKFFSLQGGSFSNVVPGFLKRMLGIPPNQQTRRLESSFTPLRRSDSSGSLYRMYGMASRGLTSVREFVIRKRTDQRRGVIEDMQLVVELSIERVFDVLRKVLLYCLSPLQTVKVFTSRMSTHQSKEREMTIQTATLGESNPAPTVKKQKQFPVMNTDARSCEDVITDLGYPYEAIRVVTEDGYVLLLERIPRSESRKVVYLQHGVLDSSLGWVSNGVVGSQAFAAHDQGYDVFLGNFRGLASQEHVDKNISSRRYWDYSVNEHGTRDIPAMIEKIHAIKSKELGPLIASDESGSVAEQPYKLCAVAHSLGGAGLIMYVVTRRLENKPHHLSRLILLSPAGFHKDAPIFFDLVQYLLPAVAPILAPLMPGFYIKTRIFRGLFNKLARDFQNYPALGGLVQTLCSYLLGGDSSNWVEALGQTHYNVYDMPGLSLRVVMHMAQMRRADRFQMYDFGSKGANMRVYGIPYPLDIGKHYGLIDIPVDIVAGRKDKLIPRSNVRRHYQLLRDCGCTVSYSEFEYAHLDFTFAHREELLAYVMSKLLLVTNPSIPSGREIFIKSLRTKGEVRKDQKRQKASKSSKSSDLTNGFSKLETLQTSNLEANPRPEESSELTNEINGEEPGSGGDRERKTGTSTLFEFIDGIEDHGNRN